MFPSPVTGSVFYDDEVLYACLAFHPWADGHVIIALKEHFTDLNDLPELLYIHLMKCVFKVRKAMLKVYETDLVYLHCMNEAKHVHIHLIPRKPGGPTGFDLLISQMREPSDLTDFSKIPLLSSALQ